MSNLIIIINSVRIIKNREGLMLRGFFLFSDDSFIILLVGFSKLIKVMI